MYHGHPPNAAREYAQRDLELLGIVHDMMHTLPDRGGNP